MCRADGLANADLAGALGDGDQHDVHDADAADEQGDEGHDQQHDSQRERNVFRGTQDGSERLNVILGLGRVTTAQQLFHLTLHAGHVVRMRGLRAESAQHVNAGVVLHQRKGNDHGFALDIRQAEGGHALAKDDYNCEGELAHANRSADRIFQAEHAIRQLLSYQANFAARLHVGRIEISSADNDQTPDSLKPLGHSDECYGAFHALYNDGHGQLAVSGDFLHAGNGGLHRVHVLNGQLVTQRLTFCASANQLHPNQVGAGSFNLAEHEFAAGKGDGDDQNDGGAADDHAQGSENGAQLVATQGVDGDGQRLPQVHHGANLRRILRSTLFQPLQSFADILVLGLQLQGRFVFLNGGLRVLLVFLGGGG